MWESTDLPVWMQFNFTDRREKYDIWSYNESKYINQSTHTFPLPFVASQVKFGEYVLANASNTTNGRSVYIGFSDVNHTHNVALKASAIRCIGGCIRSAGQINIENTIRWSENPWSPMPVDGGRVFVKPTERLILDMDTPILNEFVVEGELVFDNPSTPLSITL